MNIFNTIEIDALCCSISDPVSFFFLINMAIGLPLDFNPSKETKITILIL